MQLTPKPTKKQNKQKRFNCMMDAELLDLLRVIADEEEVSMTWLVINALEEKFVRPIIEAKELETA